MKDLSISHLSILPSTLSSVLDVLGRLQCTSHISKLIQTHSGKMRKGLVGCNISTISSRRTIIKTTIYVRIQETEPKVTAALCNRLATGLQQSLCRAIHPTNRHLRCFPGSPVILGFFWTKRRSENSYVKSISSSRSLSCSSSDSCEAERAAGWTARVKFPAKRASVPVIRCMFPSQRGRYSPFHLCPQLWCPPWTSCVYRTTAYLPRKGPARWSQVYCRCPIRALGCSIRRSVTKYARVVGHLDSSQAFCFTDREYAATSISQYRLEKVWINIAQGSIAKRRFARAT